MGNDSLLSYLDSLAPLSAEGLDRSGALGTLSQPEGSGKQSVAELAAKTTDKGYRFLVRNINATSYSVIERLNTCPRAFALDKIKANNEIRAGVPEPKNLDFVYGHSVGAGAQGLLATGNDLDAGLFAGFISWNAEYDFGTEEVFKRKNKSMLGAQTAIAKFHNLLQTHELLSQYEVLTVDSGRPAVELAFCLDTGDGYQYYGHIDVIVRNKHTGKLAILELKTTGLRALQPAMYANSNQALGYAVALDSIAPGNNEYDVIYCVYQTSSEEWSVLEFHKSLKKRAEWLQDLLLTHSMITNYRRLNHFPKNGSNCIQFQRVCSWFGECDYINKELTARMPVLSSEMRAEEVDYYFHIDDVVKHQKGQQS